MSLVAKVKSSKALNHVVIIGMIPLIFFSQQVGRNGHNGLTVQYPVMVGREFENGFATKKKILKIPVSETLKKLGNALLYRVIQ